MHFSGSLVSLGVSAVLASAQNILTDSGTYGTPLEIVHLYYGEWPTGITVSSTGRKFSNFPPALDPMNQNYTVAELTTNTTETPYPSVEMNSPPGGRVNYSVSPAVSAAYPNYLIGVQSVVIDAKDRLWILDTGRVALANNTQLPSAYGGPKLVGVDLGNNSVFQTILFPQNIAYPNSYLNDVRLDLRPSISASGQGIAYITDSSPIGANAIIIVDLGTGDSWRHLVNTPSVHIEPGLYINIFGSPVYTNPGGDQPITSVNFGADSITLSADGETLYFGSVGRYLYSVPTALLRARGPTSELLASGAVQQLTQKGVSDGFESDSNNIIYMGSVETNSIVFYNPSNGTVQTFVRDPRMSWTDTMSVATDGYLYFTENQMFLNSANQGGVDRKQKPYVLFRAPLIGNGTKIKLM